MATDPTTAQSQLAGCMRVLRRRKLLIALVVVLGVAGTLAVSFLQTPKYTSTAQVLIQPSGTPQALSPNNTIQLQPSDIDTQVQLITSAPVRAAVTRQVGPVPTPSVQAVGQTDVISIASTSTDPHRASTVANAFATSYVGVRRTQAVDAQLAAAAEIQGRISDLRRQMAALSPQDPAESALADEQAAFRTQLGQLQVNSAVETGGAQVASPASVPTSPSSPRILVNALIGLVVSLIVGIGLAFLRNSLDDSIQTKEDLERAAARVPVLGLIPRVAGWRKKSQAGTISLNDPHAPAAEAYRNLRTAIQFLHPDSPIRTLQITSSSASEGKSTTVANLAVTIARASQRVIIVCCDLRAPRIHEFLGLTNEFGFTSVFLGERQLENALQPVPGENGVSLLAAGPMPPNPAELLASERTTDLLMSAKCQADVVLLDCPPVLPMTDAAVLSRSADATLVVASSGKTRAKEVGRALEVLHQVDSPVVGTILNNVVGQAAHGFRSTYGYHGPPLHEVSNGSSDGHSVPGPVFRHTSSSPNYSFSPTSPRGE